MWIPVLSIAAFIAMVLNLTAEYIDSPGLRYLTKPMVMVFVFIIACLIPAPLMGYKGLILLALVFSTAGDVFLMLPNDMFLGGLISFLIAHLFFSAAMLYQNTVGGQDLLWALPFILYGILILAVLLPKLKKALKIPVIAYVTVIMSMGFLTTVHHLHMPQFFSMLSVIAALLFIFSDSCLAFNRFHTPFGLARHLTLSTYFTSQWLFALSIYGVLL